MSQRLVTLDEDFASRLNLSLAVLETAAEGEGRKAAVAQIALNKYREAIAAGESAQSAIDAAQARARSGSPDQRVGIPHNA